jgi:hypothetical protein
MFTMHYNNAQEGRGMVRKLHVEITPANWQRMKDYIESYNNDPRRVTPRYRPADVLNRALDEYLREKKL